MTLSDLSPETRAFLEQFNAARETSDANAHRHLYAETFLSLDPVRATPVPREVMLAALPQRRKMFESIGATTTELTEATEHPLDEKHMLLRTSWHMKLAPANGPEDELMLHSSFLLRREESGWTIVAYLNHQDVSALVAEKLQADAASGT